MQGSAGGVQRQIAAVDAVFGEVARADAVRSVIQASLVSSPRRASIATMSSLDRRRGGR
jgi:hypothetical protein